VALTEGNSGDTITDLYTWCAASRHYANKTSGGKLALQKCKVKVLQEKMPSYLNKISLLGLETLDKDL